MSASASSGLGPNCEIDVMGHVWTAPAVQEESDFLRSVRVQPCIRPLTHLQQSDFQVIDLQ